MTICKSSNKSILQAEIADIEKLLRQGGHTWEFSEMLDKKRNAIQERLNELSRLAD